MRLSGIYILSSFLLVVSSCKEKPNVKSKAPVEIPTIAIEKKNLKLEQSYVSDIQAIRNVEIRSKISGFLESIHVDEGRTVKKGQILFRVGDSEYKNEVAKARALHSMTKADKKIAEVEYSRVKILVDKKIVSHTELDLAKSKLAAAASKVEEAKSNLDMALYKLSYTVIRAPFDGIINRIPLKSGSLIEEGALMTSVSDISSVYAYFNISENEYLKYKRALQADPGEENKTVRLILSDGKEYEYSGKVETVVSEFDESTGSIAFRAKFPNPHQLLKHNATGKVRLATQMDGVLLIPQKSVFEVQDKNYAYVVDSGNVVRMKSFIPGGRTKQFYIIKSGLKEGDVIAYEGIQELKDGMQIQRGTVSEEHNTQITAL